jgi:hypothetical protein
VAARTTLVTDENISRDINCVGRKLPAIHGMFDEQTPALARILKNLRISRIRYIAA